MQSVRHLVRSASFSGLCLFLAAVFALLWANSAYYSLYQVFNQRFLFVINDGLMTFFFLLIGIELKKGFITGELRSFSQVLLPAGAALGGMIVPALIYIAINHQNATVLNGWAIPVATDIAFALAALSLFGSRVPAGLKLFLLSLAIFDDLGAILIIAFFYAEPLHFSFLLGAVGVLYLSTFFQRFQITALFAYFLTGGLVWYCLLRAGVHPTLAGILIGLTVPDTKENSPLIRLEQALTPWVNLIIVPLFAVANAGFSFETFTIKALFTGPSFGIIAGLVLGKPVGVFGSVWLLIKLKLSHLPKHTTWGQVLGTSFLCGIGFTMSLFLGTLAFQNEGFYLSQNRLSVISGSVIASMAGMIILSAVFALERGRRIG